MWIRLLGIPGCPRPSRRWIALIVTAGTLLAAPVADAFIYWSHYNHSGSVTRIGRAELDGTGSDPGFIRTGSVVADIAVSSSHLYWDEGSVVRASLRGTQVTDLIPNTAKQGLAIDASHIFYVDGSFPGPISIGRSDLDGTNPDGAYIEGMDGPVCGLAVSGSHIYWSHWGPNYRTGTIGRASLDGSDVDQNFITNVHNSQVCGVAVNGGRLYWAEAFRIGRAKLNGTRVQHNFIRTRRPHSGPACGVAINARHIYWAYNFTLNPSIGRARIDGSHVKRNFIRNVGGHVGYTCMNAVDAR